MTAIGYHHAGDGSLQLDPIGRQGNAGLFARLWHKLAGTSETSLVWYQLRGDRGPGTSVLSVGAAPGTDVYSPVDGTVVGITDYVLSNRTFGARVDIRPLDAPSVVVSMTHLRADPALTVGSTVEKAVTKVGHDRRPHLRRAPGARPVHAGRGQQRLAVGAAGRAAVGSLKILFVGDVVGAPGRRAVEERLPQLKEELGASFCIVNGENAADGVGITPKLAARILAAGADVITLGNHTWRRSEIGPYLADVRAGDPARQLLAAGARPRADGPAGRRRDAGGRDQRAGLALPLARGLDVRADRRARRGGTRRRRR